MKILHKLSTVNIMLFRFHVYKLISVVSKLKLLGPSKTNKNKTTTSNSN